MKLPEVQVNARSVYVTIFNGKVRTLKVKSKVVFIKTVKKGCKGKKIERIDDCLCM